MEFPSTEPLGDVSSDRTMEGLVFAPLKVQSGVTLRTRGPLSGGTVELESDATLLAHGAIDVEAIATADGAVVRISGACGRMEFSIGPSADVRLAGIIEGPLAPGVAVVPGSVISGSRLESDGSLVDGEPPTVDAENPDWDSALRYDGSTFD